MTEREKAIVTAYTGITMLQGEGLESFYKYVDGLFGRPVYTHEHFILADEIKKRSRDDFIALCRKTEPEQKWIPCKERPPEEEGWYLCSTTVLTKSRELYFYPSTGKWIDNIRKNMFDLYRIYGKVTGELVTEENECVDWTDKVTAWMPLPEPYKEEQNGDQDTN